MPDDSQPVNGSVTLAPACAAEPGGRRPVARHSGV